MIVINNTETQREGEWMDINIWGTTIGIKVRARTDAVVKVIREKFKNMREGKKKDDAVLDAIYDYVVEDIRGVGEKLSDGTISTLDLTIENKKRVLFMNVPIGEKPIVTRVIDKSNELAFEVYGDELKN